ncbi:MAG: thiolase family protein [Nitrospinae bacterium]|nr:thiolase family protein [Nitrospinota bacterium]
MWPLDEYSFIYSAIRTPIGKFRGSLASLSAPELASFAIREALLQSGVSKEKISDVILGNVLSAGLGQAPARQAAHKAGLPYSVHTMGVSKVCGSGLVSVMLGDDLIRLHEAGFVVVGGMESMSRAPCMHSRHGKGDPSQGGCVDHMVHDGLWDSFTDLHMGSIAEKLAVEEGYSREVQDGFALESFDRARKAQKRCRFSVEIVPVTLDGETKLVDKDEGPFAHDLNKIGLLKPVFDKENGTITAANASGISDGAAALVIGPQDRNLNPLARIVAQATVSRPPEQFPLAPVDCIQHLLKRWGVKKEKVDLFEINEAFSVTTLAVCDKLGLDRSRVNVSGGAVALGHPIGASGARILVTLVHELRERNLRRGVAAICIGGGEAVAVGIDRDVSGSNWLWF